MGRPAGWMTELTGRAPMKSPGKPSLRRDVERLFWREIAKGLSSEEAALAVGASQAVATRLRTDLYLPGSSGPWLGSDAARAAVPRERRLAIHAQVALIVSGASPRCPVILRASCSFGV